MTGKKNVITAKQLQEMVFSCLFTYVRDPQVLSRRILNKKNIHLQFLHFLGPFCMQNKNLYPKNLWLHVLWRAGLTRAGQSSHSAQMGWIGRPWLARPSKGHEATDFWGIYSCSTRKKVPKNAKFVDVYCFCLTFVYSGTVQCKVNAF